MPRRRQDDIFSSGYRQPEPSKTGANNKDHMLQSPTRLSFAGDFNDTPISFAYHTLSEGMKDCFIEKDVVSETRISGSSPRSV